MNLPQEPMLGERKCGNANCAHNLGRGTLVVLDVVPESGTPSYEQRRAMLGGLCHGVQKFLVPSLDRLVARLAVAREFGDRTHRLLDTRVEAVQMCRQSQLLHLRGGLDQSFPNGVFRHTEVPL